jgi:hypothetical protein
MERALRDEMEFRGTRNNLSRSSSYGLGRRNPLSPLFITRLPTPAPAEIRAFILPISARNGSCSSTVFGTRYFSVKPPEGEV